MALYRSPVEPYQESQGAQETPSPVELQAFYEIQRRESQEKRLTKRKSGGPTALWARKSLKRSPTAPSAPTYVTGSSPPSQPTPSPQNFRSLSQDTARHAQHFDTEKLEDQKEKLDHLSQMNHSASLVPDNDLPAWYNKDIWASVPPPMYKASYRLHNPVGPRWYKNYHLIPPSQLRPAARPPSVFSPSFPPMGTTSMPERSLDSRMAGPSRTPSGSPLPTPSSSQTRVADAAQKPRSRKPSLTTPDGIELDITDPWGATWHHPSPYDFGISPTNTIGTSASENSVSSRPRRASMTGFQIKRKAAPSPLSQSTSAVHLQPLTGPNVLRKLSKRKTATIGTIFGRSSEDKRNAVSLPVTPVDGPNTAQSNNVDSHDAPVAHHELSASAVSSSSASIMTKTSKKEKRGSVLGRLAKKFSLLKKSSGDTESVTAKDDWHYVSPEGPKYNPTIQPPLAVAEPASTGDVHSDLSPPLNEPVPHVSQDADRSSSISLEVPFAAGRLTVVNPDLPSNENTPIGLELPLPPEKLDQPAEPEPSPVLNNAEALQENSFQPSSEPLSSSVLPALTYVAQYSQPAEPVMTSAPPEQTPHNDLDVEESLPPTPPAKSRAPSPALPPPILSPEIILQDTPRNAQSPVASSHDSSTITARQAIGHSASPSGIPSQVLSQPDIPLTLNDDSVLVPPRARFSYADSFIDSPMSTSSLDVGPPTPHNPPVPIPTSPRSHLPHPLMNETSSLPKGTRQSTKKTETFKLVRGTPGRGLGSTDTIVAAGQQWEVVETIDKSLNKARTDEQKGGRKRSPESHHETGNERVNREQERQRVRETEKLVTSEARMKEHHRDKERRPEPSHEDKERRKEWSRDEREEKRRHAERERERQKEHEREREAEKERERLKQQKEWERERERQRQKDLEREREKERQREKEKERERQKERERERQKERERERQKERERERQKEQEKERQKELERERQREQERERERQREQEKERERQRENERRQMDREREKEREREKARQREREHEEREREQRHREKKERERERRDQERRSRHTEEGQRHRTSSQSHVHHKHEAREGSTSTMSISEARHGHQRSDEQEGQRIRWPERRDGELPPVPTQSTVRPPLHRNLSSTSRPTSELPSTAELMALRAKDAYEMERLFKARSMYGQEPEEATPKSIPSNLSDMGSTTGPGTVYGSNHTAYVFNSSFHNPRHHSNPPLPHSRNGPYLDRPHSYLSDLGTIPSLDSPTNRPFSNPLPEPPRQSTYQPTPLALLESSSTQASDYWTKYTITTAH